MKTENTIKQVREENRQLSATNGLIPFIVLFTYSKTRRRYGINFLKPDTALNSEYNAEGGGVCTVVEPLHVDTEAYPKTYGTEIARVKGCARAEEFTAPYKHDDAANWIKVTFTDTTAVNTYVGCAVIHGIKSDAEARALSVIKQRIQKERELCTDK